MYTRLRTAWWPTSLVLTLLALPACTSARRGDVHGKVSYRNKPVLSGSVVLIGSDNMPVVGRINSDGTYSAAGVPAGTVRVAVLSPNPNRPRPPDKPPPGEKAPKAPPPPLPKSRSTTPETAPRKWFPLPKQYAIADTSGITTTIHGGDNTFDIELK